MSKKTEWIAAIGVVIVAVVLASVQQSREKKEVEETKRLMTQVTNIFIEAVPETKF